MHDMQLHNEYEKDKQQAMDRIAAEVEQSIVNMRNGIEQKYDRYRNELIQKLETEQKDRLAAIKRRQWVSFMSLFIVKENWGIQARTVLKNVVVFSHIWIGYMLCNNVKILLRKV